MWKLSNLVQAAVEKSNSSSPLESAGMAMYFPSGDQRGETRCSEPGKVVTWRVFKSMSAIPVARFAPRSSQGACSKTRRLPSGDQPGSIS